MRSQKPFPVKILTQKITTHFIALFMLKNPKKKSNFKREKKEEERKASKE